MQAVRTGRSFPSNDFLYAFFSKHLFLNVLRFR